MLKILIVDDKLADRFLLQEMLGEYGQCFGVASGFEAVEAFGVALDRGVPFHLVVMDLFMPGMDGREAIERIRALENNRGTAPWDGVKILVATVSKDLEDIRHTVFEGLTSGYLVKPVTRETLDQELLKLSLI